MWTTELWPALHADRKEAQVLFRQVFPSSHRDCSDEAAAEHDPQAPTPQSSRSDQEVWQDVAVGLEVANCDSGGNEAKLGDVSSSPPAFTRTNGTVTLTAISISIARSL
jgi:hypothetical protein